MLGKIEKRNRLIENNFWVVNAVVATFEISSYDIRNEMRSAAHLEIIKAAESFNRCHGAKFSTYAYNSIRDRILHELTKFKHRKRPKNFTINLSEDAFDEAEARWVDKLGRG